MRTMVKFTLPAQKTNPLVDDGSVGQNMEEGSKVITKLEHLWLELGATIELFPVATPDELRAGLQSL